MGAHRKRTEKVCNFLLVMEYVPVFWEEIILIIYPTLFADAAYILLASHQTETLGY